MYLDPAPVRQHDGQPADDDSACRSL